MSESTWRARFVHPQHPWRDFERPFSDAREIPPASIRKPGTLAGMPAVDIYLLSDSIAWPDECVFTYTRSVVGDLRSHEPPEHCLDLEG
jgi:hypothetical protein